MYNATFKHRVTLVLTALAIMLFSFSSVLAITYEQHISGTAYSAGDIRADHYDGCTILATSNHTANGIWFRMGGQGSTPDFEVHLTATSGGNPLISTEYATGNFTGTELTYIDDLWNHDWEYIPFETPYDMIDGVLYFAYANIIDDLGDLTNRVYLMSDTAGVDSYTDGGRFKSIDSGSSWPYTYPTDDVYFKIEGGLAAPSVTLDATSNVTWNSFLGAYDAMFNATLDDDGGEECQIAWKYQVKDADAWSVSIYASGNYTDGQSANRTVSGQFDLGVTYEYYVMAFNSEELVSSAIQEFTPVLVAGLPEIVTFNYPIDIDSDNLTLRLYGKVLTDGTDNVTGYFYYRQYLDGAGVGDWLVSDNVTDLQTGDGWSVLISDNLTYGYSYEYQAGGVNIYGEALGSIGYCAMAGLSTPAVTTLPAGEVEAHQAYVSANVTDLGGDESLACRIQYREVGQHVWQQTDWQDKTEVGAYGAYIYGLTPYTDYEFRGYVWCFTPGIEDEYEVEGDILSFATLGAFQAPVMITGNVTYAGVGAVLAGNKVSYDGGSSVSVAVEYREKGYGYWSATANSTGLETGLETGESVNIYISGLTIGQDYEYRSKGTNENGVGYGGKGEFRMLDGSVTTPGDVGGGTDTENIFEILNNISDNVKYILVILGSAVTYGYMKSKKAPEFICAVFPILIVSAAIAFKWVDLWVVVLISIVAGGIIFWIVKR